MENKKPREKTIKVAISLKYNDKLNGLLLKIKQQHPHSLVTKQRLVECAIDKISESDALSLGDKFKDRRAMVLKYLKEDSKINDPQALISLLQK